MGPQSSDELLGWAQSYAGKLASLSCGSQLKENLCRGLLLSTDFSGLDAPRECLRCMLPALSEAFQTSFPEVVVARSCDVGKPQRDCLMLQSEMFHDGASCVFTDILGRLGSSEREWLEAAGPLKNMDVNEARAANQNVEQFLSSNRGRIFSASQKSYCCQHNQNCPVHALPALRERRRLAKEAADPLSEAPAVCSPSPVKKRRQSTIVTPWWQKHVTEDPSDPEPITCSVAGLLCTDFSPLGKKRGLKGTGVTEPLHAIWKNERQWLAEQGLEDMFFTENSAHYPVQDRQVDAMQSSHDVKFVTVSPCELGDAYIFATDDEIHNFVQNRAQRRNSVLPVGFKEMPMRQYLHQLLPPGAMLRLAKYDSVRPERAGITGSFFAHLDHNVDCGPRCGPLIPSLDTHANIFCWTHDRLLLPQELLQAQGITMCPSGTGESRSPLAEVLMKFNDTELRLFAGNSLHVPTFAAWMMYALAHVAPIPHLQLTPQLEALYDQLDAEGEHDETLQPVPDRIDAPAIQSDAPAIQSPAFAEMQDENSGNSAIRRRPRLLL
ncbi:unnamed protein product [Symbiodinium sp. CCMP2592]|nr:unnamed protein product [Symbiodinium sp. CCMP2592]